MSNNKQIDVDLVNFIAEKIKNVKSPMNLSKLCREFKKKNGKSYTDNKLIKRLQYIRDKMSEMESVDMEIKVKMIFALGSPVSNGLLIELRKQADIKLDEQHRIIKYKKKGNGLQLSGVHFTRSCGTGNEKEMMKFLSEKSKNATSPMSDLVFLREFDSLEECSKAGGYSYARYNLLKQHIYLAPEFDEETKIKMIFVSNTKVHANILEELRKNAVVEVDKYQRITRYEANNGSLKLKGNRKKMSTSLEPATEWSEEEKDKLLSFVAEKSKQTEVPLVVKHLIREFAEKNGVCRTESSVKHHISKIILPNISKLNDFDIETRARMLFALSVSVDEGVVNKLRKEAFVEVDEYQKITKYEANDGKLKLETKRLPPSAVWSKEENHKLWKYIAERSKQSKKPLNIISLSREFVEKNRISRTKIAVLKKIRRSVRPNISKQDDVDMETKLRMIFALSVPVDEKFLNKLRKKASVNLDKKRRITIYKANDGSLELDGDHSQSAKIKTVHARRKSKSVYSKYSETNEETEDYDDEQDEEEEVVKKVSRPNIRSERLSKRRYPEVDSFCDSNDDAFESSGNIKKTKTQKTEKITKKATPQTQKGRKSRNAYFSETDDEPSEEEYEEEKEFEANSSTRRSGRISNKRCPDNDFPCAVDDVSFDYPENANDSKIEEVTEKLVKTPSDSSSKVIRVENQKRKIFGNPSDVISSLSKTKKYRRVTNTQNDAESEITDEVKYDIGESLSHKEVKPEDLKYKPDLSFLFNTPQYTMQNFPVADGIHIDDVGQSSEDTEEMTSGKEFLKLLRGLVDTLDSSILVELQSKVEKAIKELEEKDHKIPIDDIVIALNTGLVILNKNATIKPTTGESTSLRDFYLMFRSTLSTFCNSSLNNFQLKIKENIKKLDNQDKVIPIESIRPVLETVLLLAIP